MRDSNFGEKVLTLELGILLIGETGNGIFERRDGLERKERNGGRKEGRIKESGLLSKT